MLEPLGHVGAFFKYLATARRQHKSDLLTAQQLATPLSLPPGLELTWIGTAGFRIAYQGTVIWIDPYVTRNVNLTGFADEVHAASHDIPLHVLDIGVPCRSSTG